MSAINKIKPFWIFNLLLYLHPIWVNWSQIDVLWVICVLPRRPMREECYKWPARNALQPTLTDTLVFLLFVSSSHPPVYYWSRQTGMAKHDNKLLHWGQHIWWQPCFCYMKFKQAPSLPWMTTTVPLDLNCYFILNPDPPLCLWWKPMKT